MSEQNSKDAPKIKIGLMREDELLQAVINMEILGKPKCKTKRSRFYGSKGNNRR